jgi:hypothetical protein
VTAADRNTQRPTLDPAGVAGMVIVGVAAAVLSFSTWVHLAEAVGFDGRATIFGVTLRLAWLLPIAIDCYTVTVIRVWLRSPAGSAVLAYAKANALAAIVLSVAGQAAFHAFSAAGVRMVNLWWFAIIVGGIPPALLGLVMDLYTRMKHEAGAAVEEAAAAVVAVVEPASASPRTALAAVPVAEVAETVAPATANPKPVATPRATKADKPRKTAPAKPATAPVAARTDDELYAIVKPAVEGSLAATGETPSQKAIYQTIKTRTGNGVGFPKIAALIERAQREAQQALDATEPPKTNGHPQPDLVPARDVS